MQPKKKKQSKEAIKRRVLHIVKQTINEFKMVRAGGKVLIGVSGGPDSMALLHILNELVPELSLKLAVAHLNHGLRVEAKDEAEFVTSICDGLGITCHVDSVDVNRYRHRHKLSVEDAGRQMRYAFFTSVMHKYSYDKIALGHHADDNAEQVLIFLLRGSGSVGFAGIPPVRDGKIIRPLLRLPREEITNYLTAFNIESVSDRSNQDVRFLRNRVRHRLIPYLQRSYNPQIIPALNRLSEILRDESHWMSEMATISYTQALLPSGNDQCRLSVLALSKLPKAARRLVIRKAISKLKGDLRQISFTHVEAVLHLIESNSMQSVVLLPGEWAVRRIGESLCIFAGGCRKGTAVEDRSAKRPTHQFCYRIKKSFLQQDEPLIIHISELNRRISFSVIENSADVTDLHKTGQEIAFFDMCSLDFPITLRNTEPGDRFSPFGLQGTQKIKKFFIDHKVPRHQRWNHPVLMSGERIIWLVGHRIAEGFKVRPSTSTILRVELAC
jgi:tRNA(Ile)-lysidine synthase